jgi:hypothetical protein
LEISASAVRRELRDAAGAACSLNFNNQRLLQLNPSTSSYLQISSTLIHISLSLELFQITFQDRKEKWRIDIPSR